MMDFDPETEEETDYTYDENVAFVEAKMHGHRLKDCVAGSGQRIKEIIKEEEIMKEEPVDFNEIMKEDPEDTDDEVHRIEVKKQKKRKWEGQTNTA